MRLTVWDLPGPRRWLDRALANVADGRPLIVVSPDPDRPTNLGGHLTTELEERLGCDVEVVDPSLAEHHEPSELGVAVADAIGLDRPRGTRFGADAFASHPDLQDVVCVIDARGSQTAVVQRWVGFTAAVADAAQALPPHERARLVLLVDGCATPVVPPQDSNLSVSWWWGVLSPLDVSVYIHDLGLGATTAAEVVEVGRWDLELVDELATSRMRTVDRLTDSLPSEIDRGLHGTRAPETPRSVHGAWAAGLVESWDGCLDLHVSLAGDLERRIWIAQIRTVFPWLERLRLEMVERVTTAAVQAGIPPAGVAELELSRLKGWLHDNRVFLPRKDYRLLCQAVRARHNLAHLDPLSATDISELEQMAVSAAIRARLR